MFPQNGEGWFETNIGYSATELVKRLKKTRRHNKDRKDLIDDLIKDVRTLKEVEIETTLGMFPWSIEHSDTIKELGLSEMNLKALRKFGDNRNVSLQRACYQWEKAEEALKMLDEYEDVWGDKEKKAWVAAMERGMRERFGRPPSIRWIDSPTRNEKH